MATWVADGSFGVVLEHTTTRDEGDFAIDAEPVALAARRRGVVDHPWVWLRQVHGADVVVVTADDAAEVAGAEGDALVTASPELVLAVQTADCVPITFRSPEGVIGVAHAGWRGLAAGVVERTIDAMRDLGAESIWVRVGPHIEAQCYEFGSADLDGLAADFGYQVRSTTSTGHPALDLNPMVFEALQRGGARAAGMDRGCTACLRYVYYSHRARGEAERMATITWRERSYENAMTTG